MRALALALALAALSAVARGSARAGETFDPDTPVATKGGATVPLSQCLFKRDLRRHVAGIARQMAAFGIGHATCRAYKKFVKRRMALQAAANHTVVCIPRRNMRKVGKRLGTIILDVVNARADSVKRGARGGRAGAGGNAFGFDGHDRDDSFHRQCCVCDADTEHVYFENGGNPASCGSGPCCPNLCEALDVLNQAATDGYRGCCKRGEQPCFDDDELDDGRSGGAGNAARST